VPKLLFNDSPKNFSLIYLAVMLAVWLSVADRTCAGDMRFIGRYRRQTWLSLNDRSVAIESVSGGALC
jgi:hypothetical protein